MEAPGRKTGYLEVAVPDHARAIEGERTEPRAGCIILRRRPEVGVIRKTVKRGTATAATRKSSKSAAVGSSGIWR